MSMDQPRKGKVLSISLAHVVNDWYMNYIQTLLPFLVAAGLGVSKGAFLISAFTITSSLLQPVAGYLVDQKNQRWMVYLGTLWMAGLLSLVGVVKSYPLLVLLVTLAGLGTAAFHPQASSMVSAVSGRRKGLFQALFITSGNIGWALTPLMLVPFVLHYGIEASPVFVLLGVAAALLLWLTAPRVAAGPKAAPAPLREALNGVRGDLSRLVLVVATRHLTYFGMVSFLPLYLQQQGVPLVNVSRLIFLMLFAGALGGLAGGYLSDLLGRKPVIVGSLLLTSPFFYLFLNTAGILSQVLLALAGAFLMASFSVTVVVAQEMLNKNSAVASGLMMGFAIGAGGLGVGLVGLLAEHWGLGLAIQMLFLLPLPAGLMALSLKGGRKVPTAAGA